MTGNDVAKIAREFYEKTTCYLKGFWGQKPTKTEFDRVAKLYPDNATKYGNQKEGHYVNTDCFPFDCVNFVKAITSGALPTNRITYTQLKNGPLGDCSTDKLYNKLVYDCVKDGNDVLPGMVVSSAKHAGIVLGVNCWIDANFTGTNKQNGLAIHYSDPVTLGYKVGKIPGIIYEDVPVKDDVQDFLAFLYEQWKGSKK